jgi:hypothetical protein
MSEAVRAALRAENRRRSGDHDREHNTKHGRSAHVEVG